MPRCARCFSVPTALCRSCPRHAPLAQQRAPAVPARLSTTWTIPRRSSAMTLRSMSTCARARTP
jgi:hypothetical protein